MIQKVVFSVLSSSSSLLLLFFFFFVATKSCCCRVSTRVRERFGSRFFLCVVFFSFNSSKTHKKTFLFVVVSFVVVVFLFFLFFVFFVFYSSTHTQRALTIIFTRKKFIHISIELSQSYSKLFSKKKKKKKKKKRSRERERTRERETHTHTRKRERERVFLTGGEDFRRRRLCVG